MINLLVHWEVLAKIFANTMLVSIPEEAFIVLFTLIMLGFFNFLDYENMGRTGASFKNIDFKKISICIVVPATLSNMMRYSGVDYLVSFVILLLALAVSIIVSYKLWNNLKTIAKTCLFLLIAISIVCTIEIAYVPFILHITGKAMEEINNVILYNFLTFLPKRLIEGFIIVFLFSRKGTILKANLFQSIIKNGILLTMALSITLFDVGFMGVLCYIIAYSRLLDIIPYTFKILMVVGAFLVPILNIFVFIWGLYFKENQKREQNELLIATVKNRIRDIRMTCDNIKDENTAKSVLDNLKHIEIEVMDLKDD